MKKLLIIAMVAGLSFMGFAANNTNSTSFYNAKEFGVSLGTGYSLDGLTKFQAPYSLNFNGGLFYFPYRNLGVEVNVPFYQTKGASVTEVQVGLLARLPLGRLSSYVGLGTVANWNSDTTWAYLAKGGLEFRINHKIGIFTEYQYRNADFNWGKGSASVVAGLHLIF